MSVPEFSHDTADEGFHEIQLSGKQLVFLFILVTFGLVVTFLCGVLVGRGARAVRGEGPADIAVQATVPQSADEPAAAAEPPVPATEADELTYPKRLQGADVSKDDLKDAPPAASEPKSVPAAKAPPASKSDAPPAPPDREAAPSGQPGAWVVQVVALQDRAVATSLVQRLSGKGYPAFLVTTAAGSVPRMYKVQVGRFNDRRAAEQVRQRLEKEEQFKPWISR